jgi:hypothetical protein
MIGAGARGRLVAGLASVVLAAAAAGCGQPPVPPDIPAPTLSADLAFRCGDVAFGAADLAEPAVADAADTPAAASLRRFLRSGRQAVEDLPRSGYRVLVEDPDRVVFATGDLPLTLIDVRQNGGAWTARWLGGCEPNLLLPAGLRVASWRLEVGAPEPPPDTVEITALVRVHDCADGGPVAETIVGPLIVQRPTQVLVVFAARPAPAGAIRGCPAPAPIPVEVRLGGQLGPRELVDGGFFPPRGVWSPDCCG